VRTRCIRKAQVASRKSQAAKQLRSPSPNPGLADTKMARVRAVRDTKGGQNRVIGRCECTCSTAPPQWRKGLVGYRYCTAVGEGRLAHIVSNQRSGFFAGSRAPVPALALALHVINGAHLMLRTSKAVRGAVHTRSSFLGGLAILAKGGYRPNGLQRHKTQIAHETASNNLRRAALSSEGSLRGA
jgi:hypothetical protein